MNPTLQLNQKKLSKGSFQVFPLCQKRKFTKVSLKAGYISTVMKCFSACIFLFSFFCSKNGVAQCNPGYTLLQSFNFSNSGALLTNYQVKLTLNTALPVSQGKMQVTGNDIRFTDEQCNNLSYWIESGINTSGTVIWVKVNTLLANAGTTIKMYSGNPSAPAASSGSGTFETFDDFETGSLTGWTTFGVGTWSVVLYNGSMRLKGVSLGTTTGTGALKYTGTLGNYVVDVDYLNDNSSAMGGPIFEFTNTTNYYAIHSMTAPTNVIMHSLITNGSPNYSLSWPYTHSNNIWYKWSIERNSAQNAVYFNNSKIADLPRTFAEGAGLWGYGDNTAVIYFDNFRVRKYSANTTLTSVTLPVTLTNFKAYQQGYAVQVMWKAIEQTNIKKYEIERSNASLNFTKAGEIVAKENATDIIYAWKDNQPVDGSNFYRLKVVGKDGIIKYSDIRIVQFNGKKEFMNVSPNPAMNKTINLTVGNIPAGKYSLNLYDQVGRKVYSSTILHEGRSSAMTIELPASIKSGIYNLQISSQILKLNRTLMID